MTYARCIECNQVADFSKRRGFSLQDHIYNCGGKFQQLTRDDDLEGISPAGEASTIHSQRWIDGAYVPYDYYELYKSKEGFFIIDHSTGKAIRHSIPEIIYNDIQPGDLVKIKRRFWYKPEYATITGFYPFLEAGCITRGLNIEYINGTGVSPTKIPERRIEWIKKFENMAELQMDMKNSKL
jgi:hypothetical protein